MATESLHPGSGPARRTVMAAAGAAGLTAALAACGSGAGDGDGGGADASSGSVLGATSEIPEGGGKVFADAGVVVTQPTAGDFKAFSSKCTHQGCAVKDIRDGLIICPCHDSHFSATDGSVKKGPATKPLPPAGITVEGEEIKLT
ncbi:Rieske (2Fe-2S) protein [Streptomyces sp. JB150]|uniref:Rieske (2Fe-2S) protein n=1 Tax=Streptomyces sp. JB150 TaxID=2714844 RepID=UPI0014099EF4|nr:Rieske (2Fe-2S) protein [Streptomyces sp. JB150]QIJ61492.1 Rieske (2Fe-2S) protein [Streptomyces sp. JB150]